MTEITPALGLSAYLLGRRIAGQRQKPERVPVAYLYNGVRLPKLPEWDRVAYPYSFIENLGAFGCYLYLTKEPVYYYSGYKIPAPYLRCKANGDGWGNFTEGSSECNTNFALWANHDVYYNGDNSENKYLSASKPIPVYE